MGRYNNDDVLGTGNNNCGRKCGNRVSPVQDIVHPTEIINVNRTVIRNENYYPVTERQVNETVVEDFDCGSNVNNPNNCRPRRFF